MKPMKTLLMLATIFVIGSWFFFSPMFAHWGDFIPGDAGDGRLNHLFLEHGYRFFFLETASSFWSPSWAFYPLANVLTLSDNLLGALPLYALPRVIGFSPAVSYEVWFLLCCAMNFVAMFLLCRKLGFAQIAALGGAFIFAFSMVRTAYLLHPQLLPQFWTPLCFLGLAGLWDSKNQRQGFWWSLFFFGCWALQIWAAFYLGWFLSLAALLLVVLHLFPQSRRASVILKMRPHLKSLLIGSFLFVGILLPFLAHYLPARLGLAARSWYDVRHSLPPPAAYLLPTEDAWLYAFLRAPHSFELLSWRTFQEIPPLFFGILPWLWLMQSSFRRGAGSTKIAASIFWCIFFLTLCPYRSVTLWQVIYGLVPGADAVRDVARIALLQLVPLGIVTAWGLSQIKKPVFQWLILGGLILENTTHYHYFYSDKDSTKRLEMVHAQLSSPGPCEVFFLRGADPNYQVHVDAMWLSLQTGIPTLNGYSGHVPKDWPGENPADVSLEALQEWLAKYDQRKSVCILSFSSF